MSLTSCLCKEREIPGYKYQFAADTAMTDNRHNDTPVQSQAEHLLPHPMRAASRNPWRSRLLVELVRSQSFGDFPCVNCRMAGVSRTNRLSLMKNGSQTRNKYQWINKGKRFHKSG